MTESADGGPSVHADPAHLVAVIAAHPVGVLATTAPDGAPEAALVGVAALPDGTLLIDAPTTARKVGNLGREQRVALVLGDSEVSYQVEGVARITEGVERERCALAYEQQLPGSRASDPGFAVIAVAPTWLRRYDVTTTPTSVTEHRWA